MNKRKKLMALLLALIILLSLFGVVNAKEVEGTVITEAWITDAEGKPFKPGAAVGQWEAFRINAKYELPNNKVKEGDTTTMLLPVGFLPSAPNHFVIKKEGTEEIVATGTLYNEKPGRIVLTYTKYAEEASNISGSFYFNVAVNGETQTQSGEIPVTLEVNGELIPAGSINYKPPVYKPKMLSKGAWMDGKDKTIGHYDVRVNQENKVLVGAKLVDTLLSPGVTYIEGSIKILQGKWGSHDNHAILKGQKDVTQQFKDENRIKFEGNKLTIDVGDMPESVENRGFQILYDVKLPYEPVAGEQFHNKIELTNGGGSQEATASYKIIDAGGTGLGYVFKIKLKKVDEQGQKLEGAVFDVIRDRTGLSVGKITTDANGEGEIGKLLLDDYTLKEITPPDGYIKDGTEYKITSADLNNAAQKTFEITVKNKQATSIKAKKAWENNGYVGPKKDLYFQLLADNVSVGDKKKVENTDWVEWTDLPKFDDNGAEINYSVSEVDEDGNPWADGQIWTAATSGSAANGFILTNTYNPPKTKVKATKVWQGGPNTRPTVWFKLYRQSENVALEAVPGAEIKELPNGTTEVIWANLAELDNHGKAYTFSVKEVKADGSDFTPDGYAKTEEGLKVTNKNTETVNIPVKKVWLGPVAGPVTVKLKANNQVVAGKTLLLNKDNAWTGSFENLPKYGEDGNVIKYTVAEEGVPEWYEVTVEGNQNDGFKITNNNTEAAIIEGEKTWDDNNNQDGKRPSKIKLTLWQNGVDIETMEVEPDEQGHWRYDFFGHAKYDSEGNLLIYTITEEAIEGYEPTVTGYNIKNKHTPEKTKVKVKKAWDDSENQDGKRPASVIIKLYADGVEVEGKTLTLNAGNGWTGEFTELDKYKAGEKIVYTVKEAAIGNGYNSEVTGSAENGFLVTNSYTPGKVNVEGEKIWDDNDDQDGKRPTEIKINLMKQVGDGPVVKKDTKTVKAADDWKWSWMGLPEYEGGKKVTYSITEEAIAGYTTQVNGYNVTNKHVPETITVEGEKTWNDNNDQDGKRPTKIAIKLFEKIGNKEPELIERVEVTAANGWKWKFENLAKFEGGVEIVYTIEEEAVEGYEAEINGYNVTNKHVPETITVEGEKTWNDNDDQDGKRPTEIKINLMKKVGAGPVEKIGEKTVTAADGWKWKFENLDKFEGGVEIVYTIEEEAVEGYEAEVNGYNVTNTHEVEKTRVEVTKVWEDNNDKAKKRPSSVTVRLFADGEYTGKTTELNKDGNWQGSFENLDKYKAGSEIKYTVKEEAVGNGYESEVTGSQEEGFTITNTRKPDDPPAAVYDPIYVELLAEKKLANGKLKAGQFTFELYKGTKLADTVSNDASGKVTFKARKFTSPATVKYTIKEVVGSDTKRISYDGTIYTVTVKVTDVGGKLVPSISYERDGMPYTGKLQFVNRVKPPKTGDSYTSLPLVLAMVSALGFAGAGLLKKKKHQIKCQNGETKYFEFNSYLLFFASRFI